MSYLTPDILFFILAVKNVTYSGPPTPFTLSYPVNIKTPPPPPPSPNLYIFLSLSYSKLSSGASYFVINFAFKLLSIVLPWAYTFA